VCVCLATGLLIRLAHVFPTQKALNFAVEHTRVAVLRGSTIDRIVVKILGMTLTLLVMNRALVPGVQLRQEPAATATTAMGRILVRKEARSTILSILCKFAHAGTTPGPRETLAVRISL